MEVNDGFARLARIFVPLVVTIVSCCLVMAVPGRASTTTTNLSIGSMKQLFGLHQLLKFVQPDRTSLVAIGSAPSPGGAPAGAMFDDELVIGGAVLLNGQWWVRSLQEYGILGYGPSGCSIDLARRLVPGGPVIVAQCLNGGTDGQGFVAVAGRPKAYTFPVVLLAITCGGTSAKVDGTKLVVRTEGLQPGAAFRVPGSPRSCSPGSPGHFGRPGWMSTSTAQAPTTISSCRKRGDTPSRPDVRGPLTIA